MVGFPVGKLTWREILTLAEISTEATMWQDRQPGNYRHLVRSAAPIYHLGQPVITAN
jgi:hypothetical protein